MTSRQAQIFIVSSGRSGSTALSLALSRHQSILSLSEFFMAINTRAFTYDALDGRQLWRLLSTPRRSMSDVLTPDTCPKEFMYDFSRSGLFTQHTLPPILYMTLPHLTDEPEVLYFELEAAISNRPKAPLAEQYDFLFSWLCERLGKEIWIERSGASLIFVPALVRIYPEAKFIHLFRDGRDVARSMQSYPPLNLLAESWRSARQFGVDLLKSPFRLGESRLISIAERLVSPFHRAKARMRRTADLTTIGKFWSEMTLLALQHLDAVSAERKLSVSYEELVRNPRRILGSIIDFIGLSETSSSWLDEASAMFRSPNSRQPRLCSTEFDVLTSACNPGLAALGYDVPPSFSSSCLPDQVKCSCDSD